MYAVNSKNPKNCTGVLKRDWQNNF